jgi:hypothetical protein
MHPKLAYAPTSILTWNKTAHAYSTSLTLSSSLHAKELTLRYYVWNDKEYKSSFTSLNFKAVLKPPTIITHGPTTQLLQASNNIMGRVLKDTH